MTKTIEVEVDENGVVHPVNAAAKLPEGRAILIWPASPDISCMLLAGPALAIDWLNAEEDAAWAHLQLKP